MLSIWCIRQVGRGVGGQELRNRRRVTALRSVAEGCVRRRRHRLGRGRHAAHGGGGFSLAVGRSEALGALRLPIHLRSRSKADRAPTAFVLCPPFCPRAASMCMYHEQSKGVSRRSQCTCPSHASSPLWRPCRRRHGLSKTSWPATGTWSGLRVTVRAFSAASDTHQWLTGMPAV